MQVAAAFPCLFNRHAEGIAELRSLKRHVRILAVLLDSCLHGICQLLLHGVQDVHPAQQTECLRANAVRHIGHRAADRAHSAG